METEDIAIWMSKEKVNELTDNYSVETVIQGGVTERQEKEDSRKNPISCLKGFKI